MSNWMEIYGWFYTRILRLYPKAFRVNFDDEMRAVFRQAIKARAGTGQAQRFFLRELKDLPGSLLRQHRQPFMIRRRLTQFISRVHHIQLLRQPKVIKRWLNDLQPIPPGIRRPP